VTKYFSISLAFIFLSACTGPKRVSVSERQPRENKPELIVNKDVKAGSTANFSFVNNTDNKIIVYGPAFKNIEKFENGTWRKVRINYCPCGADCIPPPKTKTLMPGEKHEYSWNLNETWCEQKSKKDNPVAVSDVSTPGLYRTTIYYSVDTLEQKELVREFNLVN